MRVAIRADASLRMGTGHVMRCLALADTLRGRGASVSFLCRQHDGHLCDLIESQGFAVSRLAASDGSWQTDADQCCAEIGRMGTAVDLLIVDHYALDKLWEQALRPLVRRILVIDDLANRPHDCDLLLDQNLHDSPESRYLGLIGESTRRFIGPRYALLRPEFNINPARERDRGLHRLLVFLGGVDPTHEAGKVVEALRALGSEAPQTKLVLGPVNPDGAELREAARGIDALSVIGTTTSMASLICEADLGVGTCGVAAWERCILGLPALVVVNAENQRDDAQILHSLGATSVMRLPRALDVGSMSCVRCEMIPRRWRACPERRRQ
jgi:UDP-2,4-diacetamido-2,4,6-trideoxy-beta-L-altropyranose hydrolase